MTGRTPDAQWRRKHGRSDRQMDRARQARQHQCSLSAIFRLENKELMVGQSAKKHRLERSVGVSSGAQNAKLSFPKSGCAWASETTAGHQRLSRRIERASCGNEPYRTSSVGEHQDEACETLAAAGRTQPVDGLRRITNRKNEGVLQHRPTFKYTRAKKRTSPPRPRPMFHYLIASLPRLINREGLSSIPRWKTIWRKTTVRKPPGRSITALGGGTAAGGRKTPRFRLRKAFLTYPRSL